MLYQFHIELQESSPHVWRRIQVPTHYTFYKLHKAILGAFGWENCHLFQFIERGTLQEPYYAIAHDGDGADPDIVCINAKRAKISKVFHERGQTFFYIYDFGDYWTHKLTFEGVIRSTDPLMCLEGEGACPPEDVGGMDGYQQMLETFRAGRAAEKREYREWLGLAQGKDWDPAYCNIREINKRLCLLDDQ